MADDVKSQTGDAATKTIAAGSAVGLVSVLVYNLEKITPFIREFGLAALVLVAGLIVLGVFLWGFWILANDTRERHWKHMDRQADQQDRQAEQIDRLASLDEKQGDILTAVHKTQGEHGNQIATTHSIVNEIHGVVKQWGAPSGT